MQDFQIKRSRKISIPLMRRCLLNLHVLHRAVVPLWDGIMMKILFRYSLIISAAQLADRLGLSALTRKTGNISPCIFFFFFYHWTITIFMRKTPQCKNRVYSLVIYSSPVVL